jgi:hypothetical protein
MKSILLALTLALVACNAAPPVRHPDGFFMQKNQSWDQENLKRNDYGCPSSIFVAPDGNLIQCD